MLQDLTITLLLLVLLGCFPPEKNQGSAAGISLEPAHAQLTVQIINPGGQTVFERINTPEGFHRTELNDSSFGAFLRHLPVKEHGAEVFLFNGSKKYRQDVHLAVINMDVGKRDLQQCADAIMRLRGEYLFQTHQFGKIQFHFTNGFLADFDKWSKGNRIKVEGNNVRWVTSAENSANYDSFKKYMETVFIYAGTLSLSRETQPISLDKAQPGDFFVQGGSPGHAVIILDVCENEKSGEKLAILAQSYMPAQEIHILKNPQNTGDNPWYSLNFDSILVTPEWTFEKTGLRRFL